MGKDVDGVDSSERSPSILMKPILITDNSGLIIMPLKSP
jgi:hypothetical protein